MLPPDVQENRRVFLRSVRQETQRSAGLVVDRLLEFSAAHSAIIELASTAGLEQPSIGYDLKNRGVMLWKAYARDEKLEVLARSHRNLSSETYAEFRDLWRGIPGRSASLRDVGEVPSIPLKALEKDSIWLPVVACLQWGLGHTVDLSAAP